MDITAVGIVPQAKKAPPTNQGERGKAGIAASGDNSKKLGRGHQRGAGFVVFALAGSAGQVSVCSKLSQDSRSCVSALSQVGKHSGGSGGCLAYPGSGGICTDLTGKDGSGAGGVAHPISDHTTSNTSSVTLLTNGLDFGGVGFLCIDQLLFCLAAGFGKVCALALGCRHVFGGLRPERIVGISFSRELCPRGDIARK